MKLITSLNSFDGIMDTDSADSVVAPTNYREMVNGVNGITNNGNNTQVENNPGTTEVINIYANATDTGIGTFEDKAGSSLIQFNYNPNGVHGIYRYFKNKPGTINGAVEKILKIDNAALYDDNNINPLSFGLQKKITGVAVVDNKLSFTDNKTSPKTIDLERANETQKKRKFDIIFNKNQFNTTSTYTLNVYPFGVGVPAYTFTWQSFGKTSDERYLDFITAVKGTLANAQWFNIVGCDTHPIIEMVMTGKFFVNITEISSNLVTYPSLVIPNNFYPDKDPANSASYDILNVALIDFVQYMPLCEPVLVGGTELTEEVSLIKSKVFQFRVRYHYLDYKKSRLGAISSVYINNISCQPGANAAQDNYIDVDFTDPRLSNPALVSIITKVDIIVRDHSEGYWKVVKELLPVDFVGEQMQKYRFRNNESIIEIIASIDEVEQYDSVPELAQSLEFAENKMFFGGLTEGKDAPCIDASVETIYSNDKGDEETFSICGIICIRNIYQPDPRYSAHQPIWDDGNKIGYGGIGKIGFLGNVGNHFNKTDKVQVFAPDMRGFTVYLAGTEYYGVSVQSDNNGLPISIGYLGGNVVEITTNSAIQSANDAIEILNAGNYGPLYPFGTGITNADIANGGYSVADTENHGVFFSRFEIQGVKAGKYNLRFASPTETTPEMLAGDTLSYQNTSAPVLKCCGIEGYEFTVTVNKNVSAINPLTGRSTVFVGVTEIADMTDPDQAGLAHQHDAKILHGYVGDSDGIPAVDYSGVLLKQRINGAQINLTISDAGGLFSPNTYISTLNRYKDWKCITDHNGFYFVSYSGKTAATVTLIGSAQYIGDRDVVSTISLYDSSGAFVSTTNDNIVATQVDDGVVTSDYRTRITGKIVNATGAPLPNTTVVISGCQFSVSDTITGAYATITYPQTSYLNTPVAPNSRTFNGLVYSRYKNCILIAIPSGESYDEIALQTVNFTANPGQYNDDKSYYLPDYDFDDPYSKESLSAWKPGSDEQFGIVYYDAADRRCAVVSSDNLKAHILFYTEKDANGVVQPTGPRLMKWSIWNEPPAYAVKYQWVRTKNLQHNAWLQWVVNKVKYVDDNYATVSQNIATYIELDFDNISYYVLNKYKNAVISAPFEKGDILRIILDSSGNYINQYVEFEIEQIIGNKYYIANQNTILFVDGMLVEMFQKRKENETNLYYEFGECYEIKYDTFHGVCKRYHVGQAQNQSYGPLPLGVVTPATGVFKTGNSYFRDRTFPVGVVAATIASPQSGTGSGQKTYYICDGSVSDFYLSDNDNTGRVNSDKLQGSTERPSTVRFSDNYIQSTKINGNATFRALNQKQFSIDYGLIEKMVLVNHTILYMVFHNSVTVSAYLNQSVLKDLAGASIVAISDDIIPRTTEMQRTYGTQDPATVVLNDEGDLYGYDAKSGVCWAASGNGMVTISDRGKKLWWKNVSELRARFNNRFHATAGYDLYRDLYVIALQKSESQRNQLPKCKICIADYIYTNGTFVLKGYVYPQGQLLFTYPVSGSGDTLNLISAGLIAAHYEVLSLRCGCISVTAPDMSYAGSTITISTETDSLILGDNSTFASVGNWNLGAYFSLVGLLKFEVFTAGAASESSLYIPELANTSYTFSMDLSIGLSNQDIQIELGGNIIYPWQTFNTQTLSLPITLSGITDKYLRIKMRNKNVITGGFVYPALMDNVKLISTQPIVKTYSFQFDDGVIADPVIEDTEFTLAYQKASAINRVPGWKSYYEYYPESIGYVKNVFVTIKDGKLYTHNSSVHNNFYGVQYSRKIKFIFNPVSDQQKGIKAISTRSLNAQNVSDITILPTNEYPQGMVSWIPKARFNILNGEWVSDVLNDSLTPGYATPVDAVVNGRELQGKEATITIIDNEITESVIKNVNITYFYIF